VKKVLTIVVCIFFLCLTVIGCSCRTDIVPKTSPSTLPTFEATNKPADTQAPADTQIPSDSTAPDTQNTNSPDGTAEATQNP
jgi:hypothetical protein